MLNFEEELEKFQPRAWTSGKSKMLFIIII